MGVAEQIESLEDRLGEGDEGKGSGYQVNAYIKKEDDGTQNQTNDTPIAKTTTDSPSIIPLVGLVGVIGVGVWYYKYR